MGKEFKNEDFRDSISTVDESGKRVWIYPKKPFGRYFNWRKILSYVLLVFFFGAPFIHINGQPLLMLNIFERKFVIFSFPFWPQDFYMFVLAMITLIIFIVLFTVIYGRIFCGWICPQTIFMEMFFRRIEYWIEGDANQQRKLDKQEWNREKILKKGSKHLIFLVSAFAIGNTFMAYLVGRGKWFEIVTHSPVEHLAGFLGVIVFSMAFYGVFAFLREQVCTTICPYGRLQSVLLDRDSIVIAYDWERGEPRGKIKKNDPKQEELGDCIDCNLCVSVCPTGIDIRNGTQLECINCTACIDACDQVMEKVDRPKGLIRYASYNNIAEKKPFRWTPRILGYTGVLVFLLMILTGAMLTRSSVETTLLKAPGSLFQKVDDQISNIYTFQLVNKTSDEFDIELRLEEIEGSITVAGEETKVMGEEVYDGAVVIKIPKTELKTGKNLIRVGVYGNGKQIDVVKTQFLAP